jgi:hypothetical protein
MLCVTFSNNTASRFYAVFALSTAPLTFFEVLARSDLIAAMMLLNLVAFILEHSPQRSKILGVVLGCAIASRFAIYPALLILILQMFKRMNLRAFMSVISLALLTASVLILPLVIWNSSIFFNYAPVGVNLQKLGSSATLKVFWIVVVSIASGSTFAINKFESVYLSVALILAIITFATWSSFVIDLSYLQLVAIPLLFSFPRTVGMMTGTTRRTH